MTEACSLAAEDPDTLGMLVSCDHHPPVEANLNQVCEDHVFRWEEMGFQLNIQTKLTCLNKAKTMFMFCTVTDFL